MGVLALFVFLVLVYCVYRAFQHHLTTLLKETPTPLLVIELSSGKLSYANQSARQLLGIRRVGKAYLLPDSVGEDFIVRQLKYMAGNSFKSLTSDWPLSSRQKVKIELAGRKTIFMGKRSWLIYASKRQSSRQEFSEEIHSLQMIKSAFDNLSELIFLKDLQGNLLVTNRAFEKFWHERVEEGSTDIKGEMKGRISKQHWTTAPDGRSCLLETYQSTLLSVTGEKLGTLGISHDVTDWHNIQKSLRDEMEKRRDTEVALAQRDTILQNILESSPDSIGIFNENMVYQACNEPFVHALGIAEVSDLIGKRLQDVVPNEMYARISASDSQVLHEGKSLRYIDKTRSSTGSYVWYDVVKSPFRDPASGTNGVLIMARDVSERYLAEQKLEEANQELARLSFIDGLTQVGNRRKFDEQLQIVWNLHVREKTPLTIMLCDIDFFKGFNDHYGHLQGDEALIKVAAAFESVLTRSSDCVARYGGEEFGFILPNTTAEGAAKIAQRLHNKILSLAIPHQASSVSEQLTVSIGVISSTPQNEELPETMVAMADSALYQAKAEGRNRTSVHPASDS